VKLALYGNVILDEIWSVNTNLIDHSNVAKSKKESMGGVVNCLWALKSNTLTEVCLYACTNYLLEGDYTFKNLNISKLHNSTSLNSSALILEDLSSGLKTSYVIWGDECNQSIPVDKDYDWIHIAYLDKLHFLNVETLKELKLKCKYLSVDFCLKTPDLENVNRINSIIDIGLIDVFFGSLEELQNYKLKSSKTSIVVEHSSRVCKLYRPKKECSLVFTDYIESNINVNGAGDYLAATFINLCLCKLSTLKKPLNSLNLEELLAEASKKTTKFILEKSAQ
jgi:hypothetical protein